jgi:endonuclease YncB( thermonuclease family)
MRAVLLLVLGILTLTAWAEILEGRVVSVADGDTVTLLDSNRQQHRIRLAGIDAPEKAQPFGQRSKQHLSNLAFGKDAKSGLLQDRPLRPRRMYRPREQQRCWSSAA